MALYRQQQQQQQQGAAEVVVRLPFYYCVRFRLPFSLCSHYTLSIVFEILLDLLGGFFLLLQNLLPSVGKTLLDNSRIKL